MSRISRLEFPNKVRIAILRRAGWPEHLVCEGCGMPIGKKKFEVDHTIECWEKPDRTELTPEDGKVLGVDCCHREKTAKKAGERAHGNRIIKNNAGIKSKSRPIPGSRASGIRKRFSGVVERW